MTNDTHRRAEGPARHLDHYPHPHRIETRASDNRGEGHIPNAQIAMYADDARQPVHRAIMADNRLADTLQLVEITYRFLHETTYPGALIVGVVAGAPARYALVKVQGGHPLPFTAEERRRAEAFLVRT